MRPKRYSSLIRRSLTMLALAVMLVSTAWAKPRFKILHRVAGGLSSGLIFDAQGNLYGVTGGGGTYNGGTLFELTPEPNGKWTETILHNFNPDTDGAFPDGRMIFDAAGNLYGTALEGGVNSGGTVFELSPGSRGWTLNVLHSFSVWNENEGVHPSGVVLDNSGNLYGVAGGGSYNEGVVFELLPGSDGWGETVLYDFEGTKTGFAPSGPLVFDQGGRIYGTTAGTYYSKAGTVFRLRKSSGGWNHRILWQFDVSDGAGPETGVVFDTAGNLYGTTRGGGGTCRGIFCGTVFRLTDNLRGHRKEAVLYGFPKPEDGFLPSSGLIFDKAGNLYGTTATGGIGGCFDGCGVVYKLMPKPHGKWNYSVLHKFDGSDGAQPGGGLILDEKGNLYGTAYTVVFEITP